MKIIIACDSFKGSLSAYQVGKSLGTGIRKIYPDAQILELPMADGGEGTVDAFLNIIKGRRHKSTVMDPIGREIEAEFAILENGIAVIEMASASGLPLISKEEQNPMETTTYGTGQLIKKVLNLGCREIVLGIGGSATNDGGVGMAQALGAVFLDRNGNAIGAGGGELSKLETIDLAGLDPRLKETKITVASDVTNPLCGENGASFVYGKQKGADENMMKKLDKNLRHYADIAERVTGKKVSCLSGAGAAGGLGAGAVLFCDATIKSGIDILLDTADFEKKIENADLILTGEGMIDGQSVQGKVPVGVARRAKAFKNISVVAAVGGIGEDVELVYDCGIDAVFSITAGPITLENAITNSGKLLEDLAINIMRFYKAINAGIQEMGG